GPRSRRESGKREEGPRLDSSGFDPPVSRPPLLSGRAPDPVSRAIRRPGAVGTVRPSPKTRARPGEREGSRTANEPPPQHDRTRSELRKPECCSLSSDRALPVLAAHRRAHPGGEAPF